MSYLVMECHPGYAVLLDEEGRFLKAANLRYEIGQTVYDPVLMKETPEKKQHTIRWVSSGIAAIAACFLLFFGFGYYQNYVQPYSSIYLTINPEVQMDLNRQGTVVKLTGTNEDGETLLEGYEGKGKDKVTVADELIDRAIEMGFLSEGGQVSFSIDSPDEALFQEYGTELRTKVTEHLDGRITITIEIINHKDGHRQESPESSSSPNSSQPTTSQPGSTSPSSPEPSQPVITLPASSGSPNYDDTDYGPGSDGVTDYTPPAVSTPPVDTDYGPGNDGVTDYNDTDYGPNNDGVTEYTPPASSTPPADTDYGPGNDGVTDYTDGNTDYDPGNDSDSGYNDDHGSDDDDDDPDDDDSNDDDDDSDDDDED